MSTDRQVLDDLYEQLRSANKAIYIYPHSPDRSYLILNIKFIIGDVYARLYAQQDDHGAWHSVLYPQRYGNFHAFRVDSHRLFEMGAYVSVPLEQAVEQVQRWRTNAEAWHEEWMGRRR